MTRKDALVFGAAAVAVPTILIGVTAVTIALGILVDGFVILGGRPLRGAAEPAAGDSVQAKALDAAMTQTGLPRDRLSVQATKRHGNEWWVFIDCDSDEIGSHCSVVVSDNGTTEYHGGM